MGAISQNLFIPARIPTWEQAHFTLAQNRVLNKTEHTRHSQDKTSNVTTAPLGGRILKHAHPRSRSRRPFMTTEVEL